MMINKIAISHWRDREVTMEGIYMLNIKPDPIRSSRKQYWIDIGDIYFGEFIKSLAIKYDVFINGPNKSFPYYKIWIDDKGSNFQPIF